MEGRIVPLSIDRLEHKQCPTKIPTTFLGYPLIELIGLRPAFLLARSSKNRADLLLCRRCNPDQQSSGSNGSDNVRGAVCQEDQSQIRAVFLHRPSERCLGIASQVVRLVDNDNLESLLRIKIHLLCLGHLLQQFLYHDTVVIPDIRWGNLKVINRRDNVELEFPVTRRLEDSGVDLDLFNSGAVQFLECRDNSSLFACTRWPVY